MIIMLVRMMVVISLFTLQPLSSYGSFHLMPETEYEA